MTITTEIGYTTPDAIHVRGMNLATEIIGKLDFVEMLWLLAMARLPEPVSYTHLTLPTKA